jgi:hypothetical protein
MVLDAIDAAMLTLGVVEDVVEPLLELDQFSPAPVITTSGYASEPPNLQQLASALKPLDPDCAEKLWKFYRLGPLAYAAREFPELAEALRDLARRWSSGDLRGIPSKKWVTPSSSNGMSGQQAFNYVWKRFMTDNYTGKRVTIGSIYHHAREVGWIYNKEQRESDDVGQVTP